MLTSKQIVLIVVVMLLLSNGFAAVARFDLLTTIMLWITMLGHWKVLIVFSVATATILLLWRKSVYILPLLFSLAGSMLFTESLKLVFRRDRPLSAVYVEPTFSFPSGHATAAVAFYGYLTYLSLCNAHSRKKRAAILITGVLVVILVGLSRVYLGVHYLSDVWGGFFTGTLWLIAAVLFSERLRVLGSARLALSGYPLRVIASSVIVSIALAFYVDFALRSVSAIRMESGRMSVDERIRSSLC